MLFGCSGGATPSQPQVASAPAGATGGSGSLSGGTGGDSSGSQPGSYATPRAGATAHATPSPAPSPTPTAAAIPLTYDASTACINHAVFSNSVLPSGVGEFGTGGFDTAFWGGTKRRTYAPAATWGPGYFPSWGRHQYDTNFGDPSQGSGFPDPFSVVKDTAVSGAPQALRIAAYPVPSPLATSLSLMGNDQYIVAHATQNIIVPAEGGSLKIDVDTPSAAHIGWKVGIGFSGAPFTFIGTLTAGGSNQDGAGGSSPWTISNIHIYAGKAGTTLIPGLNPNDYALRSYNFPAYYSGALDANVNQQYGFFVARIRLPQPAAGLSPAFWMLETGGVGSYHGQLLRSEWDTQEMFADIYGNQQNAGNILWNSSASGRWYSYGCGLGCAAQSGSTSSGSTGVYPWPATSATSDAAEYHDYGVLVQPGGPSFPTDYAVSGGTYVENNPPWSGTTFFLDGRPVAGHVGQPDLTQGSPDKELMAMFQVAAPGSWLDPHAVAHADAWPQYMYLQWIRAYKRATGSC